MRRLECDTIRIQGMEDLLERCQGYYAQGARFAKWRAVIRIDEAANLPTRACIQLNSAELARCVVCFFFNSLDTPSL